MTTTPERYNAIGGSSAAAIDAVTVTLASALLAPGGQS
jgi:hypothetical protein